MDPPNYGDMYLHASERANHIMTMGLRSYYILYGCFCKFSVRFVDVLVLGALVLGVCIAASDGCKLPNANYYMAT